MTDQRGPRTAQLTRRENASEPAIIAEASSSLDPQSDEMLALEEEMMLEEIVQLLGIPFELNQAEREARIRRAIDLFRSLDPSDGVEQMLAAQMVGTHYAVLRALESAADSHNSPVACDMYLKLALRLMDLYLKQAAALDKRRGRGQQKVTVEHVNVAAGGSAIVGNVNAAEGRRSAGGAGSSAEPPMRRRQPIFHDGTPE